VGKITFLSSGGIIHVIDADGSNERKLVSEHEFDGWAWSPDGQKLAYIFEDAIYTINVDGTGKYVVTTCTQSNWAMDRFVVWSPDGERLLYASDECDEFTLESDEGTLVQTLWLVKSDGSDLTQIVEGLFTGAPSFSPDGRQLVAIVGPEILFDRDSG